MDYFLIEVLLLMKFQSNVPVPKSERVNIKVDETK